MTLLRMLSFKPTESSAQLNSAFLTTSTDKPISTKLTEPGSAAQAIEKKITGNAEHNHNNVQAKSKASIIDLNSSHEVWPALIENLDLQGVAYSLASNCSVESVTEELITLHLAQQHEGIATKGAQQRLEKALQEYYGNKIKLKLDISTNVLETPAKKKRRTRENIQSQAEKNAEADIAVKALKSQFGAEIIEGSVKPVEN
jgi:DNA polymerase-3 subunit gamma/tau